MNIGKTMRVHLDTEFTDFVNMDLISIGLAADNGDEFYGENTEFLRPWASEWVQRNIYPLLDFSKHGYKRLELSARVWSWIDELPCDFVIITVDYSADYELMYKLFGEEKHPKIISVQNINNNIYYAIDQQVKDMGGSDTTYQERVAKCKEMFHLTFMEYFFRTKEIQHHALSDAKANREAYTKIVNKFGIPN